MKIFAITIAAAVSVLSLSGCTGTSSVAEPTADNQVAASCKALLQVHEAWYAGEAEVTDVIDAATQAFLDMADAGLAQNRRGDGVAPFGDDLYELGLDMSNYYSGALELGTGTAVPQSASAPAALNWTDNIKAICP